MTQPIKVIFTECRGLNAIETNDEHIFMGFMGSLTSINCVIKIYTHEYE